MTPLRQGLARTLASGSGASLLSLLVLALRGRREAPTAVAPINSISHWLFGDAAYAADRASLKNTGVGVVVHHVSALLWGALFEALLAQLVRRRGRRAGLEHAVTGSVDDAVTPIAGVGVGPLVAGAAVVTAIAALTDLKLVPERLTPGFQNRLRPGSVALVYVAFACGLALAAVARSRD